MNIGGKIVVGKLAEQPRSTTAAGHAKSGLPQAVHRVLDAATVYALRQTQSDGHWQGNLYCDITVTCQYVFVLTWFGISIEPHREGLIRHLLRQQRPNGSWAHSQDAEGAVSPSIEAYLALKILGVSPASAELLAAREFIRNEGGVKSARIVSRIWLASFGLISWNSLPFSPAEIILLPASWPFSIYKFAPWARSLIVPFLMIMHHQPILALPNGQSSKNTYIDELWDDPDQKTATYGLPLKTLFLKQDWLGLLIMLFDLVFNLFGGLGIPPVSFLRQYAIGQCLNWTLAHFEPTGDYAPGVPPGFLAMLAIYLEGIKADDPRMQRALAAIEDRHVVQQGDETYIRTCNTPVWDTVLMSQALLDSLPSADEARNRVIRSVDKALVWTQKRQYFAYTSDWSATRPYISSGGFCIQYHNSWNLDIDDTCAAVVAFLKRDPTQLGSGHILSALDWILGMQSSNGGWAAFEADNDNFYLRSLPFCDNKYLLCDPPVPDVTGHALEALGLIVAISERKSNEKRVEARLSETRVARIMHAIDRAIGYLTAEQEVNGSWFGRWQCNYIFGTSAVLCGLAHIANMPEYTQQVAPMIHQGLLFLQSWQNSDGGWGEKTNSYFWKPSSAHPSEDAPLRDSTISQTSWALMGLLAHLSADDQSIQRGVSFLVASQQITPLQNGASDDAFGQNHILSADPGTWTEDFSSGASIPGWMSLKYEYYPHYFPMMALGRFLNVAQTSGD